MGTFTIKDKEINVEEIMKQIKENIAQRKAKGNIIDIPDGLDLTPSDKAIYEIQHHLSAVNNSWDINIETPITSNRRFIGGLVIFVKKVIRKLLRWYFNPPLARQINFNVNITKAFNKLSAELQKQLEIVPEMQRQLELNKEIISKLKANYLDDINIDYFEFENRFRGSREEVKKRQKIYLEYFTGQDNVLDIGCGRGEFVELLNDNNINAKGIEINKKFVEYCQTLNLPVEESEALFYLGSQDDNSLGGIFLSQVVEHLTPNELIELLDLAYKKLKPGAYLVAETVNPRSLSVYINSFYMDFDHKKPVHPFTIHFIMEKIGYGEIAIRYSSPNPEEVKIPQLKGDGGAITNLKEFNEGIERLNDVLFGFQDYAIIGRR